MKQTYNIKREKVEQLKVECYAKGAGLVVALLLVISIYARIANAIIPQW